MPCNCEKSKREQDGSECPEGQRFDVAQGKCMPVNGKNGKEALDDSAQSTQPEMPEGDTGEKPQVDPTTCPDKHHWDEGQQQCVPDEAQADKTNDIGQTNTDITTETMPKWAKALSTKVDNLTARVATEKKPTAQVSNQDSVLTLDEISKEYPKALEKYGKYQFDVPLESMRSVLVAPAKNTDNTGFPVRETYIGQPRTIQEAWNRPNKTVVESYRPETLKEAVSLSGTHATQDLDTDVAIVPGGISFVPVFQFAKTKEIERGSDRVRFFKSTIPANGSQTVGSTPSEATQTITSVEVTPSTITGVYLIGDFDEIENSPFDLLQAIVEGSAASFEDFVATDMLDTVSAEDTLTPGLWIRGDTGATVTTSDTASVALDETGVFYGREYLGNQGYLRGGVKPVMFLDDQQFRELLTSSNVTSLATRSLPDIWLKAKLEEFAGVQLVVTNAVEHKSDQTNPSINAIMCVPKHSYGIGIKRNVTVKMHEIGEDNQVRVNTTWRVKAGVIDATSIVRISTTD